MLDNKANPGLKLSPNFTLKEACYSQTAVRRNIDNMPPTNYVASIIRVAENILQPCREFFNIPFSPSSWFRSIELNHHLGGSIMSQHIKGQAVDFEIPGISNLTLAQFIQNNLDFDQLILEHHDPAHPNSGWVHCSYVSASENRREVLHTHGQGYFPGLGV